MRFFFDENFPKSAAEVLERFGYDWYDPRGTELEGAADSTVIEEARRQKAVLLTTDRDFFHTLHHQYPDHSGVIVVALKQPNREAILKRLEWVLGNIAEGNSAGRTFQLRDQSWVARPALPDPEQEGEQ